MTLYEITGEIAELLNAVDDTGELPLETEIRLDKMEMEFHEKVENCLKVRQNYDTQAIAVALEIERLTAIKERYRRNAERLWSYVLYGMRTLGIQKAGRGAFTVREQKNSRPSIRTEWPYPAPDGKGGEYIPPGYAREKIEFDGQKAYADWKAGRPLPSGIVVTQGTHLRFA